MTKERLHNDMLYQAGLSGAKAMLKNGIISVEEFEEIKQLLLEQFSPYLGRLTAESPENLPENIMKAS